VKSWTTEAIKTVRYARRASAGTGENARRHFVRQGRAPSHPGSVTPAWRQRTGWNVAPDRGARGFRHSSGQDAVGGAHADGEQAPRGIKRRRVGMLRLAERPLPVAPAPNQLAEHTSRRCRSEM